jgi:ribosomal protein L11 methyltransferase
MAWHQFSVITDEASAQQLSDFLIEIGAISITFSDAENEPLYEPELDQTPIWNHTKITALFELEADLDIVQTLMEHQFIGQPLQCCKHTVVANQAWERAWMEHFKPMKFANRLWICPSGEERTEDNAICMTLDPGLAFGTGTHPTTALCLEWLAQHDMTGKVMIDYGCGSGILAIAAVLLGATHAHAIDIDPQALTACKDNADKNRVQDRISFNLADDFKPIPADVVVANILAKPLIELSTSIADLVKPGGWLILSGILIEQAGDVARIYSQLGLSVSAELHSEEWCLLEANKTSS